MKNIEIDQIEKLEELYTLLLPYLSNFLIPSLGLMDWHFHTSAKIVKKIDMYQLHRPITGFSASSISIINIKYYK